MKYAFAGALFIFVADQATKWLVNLWLPLNTGYSVIGDIFDIVNIRNRGAAFGFLNRGDIDWQIWLFSGVTILAAAVIITILLRVKNQPCLSFGMGLILGGAVGNFMDRLRFHSVVDFLDFHIGSLHWPAFNVADSGIFIGALLVFVSMWKTEQKH